MDTEKPPPESIASTAKELPSGPIVFVIGPPASGKGTLCSRLCQQIFDSFRHLSIGDYLRELCSSPELEALPESVGRLSREQIGKYLQESRLLPPDTIIPLIKGKLVSSCSPGWLIDGFPRNLETARAFEKEVKGPIYVIVLHCSPDIARERFIKRRRSSTDDHELFDKRLKEYEESLPAILDQYRDITINVHTDGTEDETWENLFQAVRTLPEFNGLRIV